MQNFDDSPKIDEMSRFSNAFAAALHSTGETQMEFAKRCGIDFRQINKYVRGSVAVGAANIQTIARHLPDQECGQVVAAWLRDMIPESASGLVGITTAATQVRESAAQAWGDLSPELHDALTYLAHQACLHGEISALVIGLTKALRGK